MQRLDYVQLERGWSLAQDTSLYTEGMETPIVLSQKVHNSELLYIDQWLSI